MLVFNKTKRLEHRFRGVTGNANDLQVVEAVVATLKSKANVIDVRPVCRWIAAGIAAGPLPLPDAFMLRIAELPPGCRGMAQLPENGVGKGRETLATVSQRPLVDAFELACELLTDEGFREAAMDRRPLKTKGLHRSHTDELAHGTDTL